MKFEQIWRGLTGALNAGEKIKGWSHLKGETGLVFKVSEVGNAWIGVLPRTENERRITKSDFEKVYASWSDYCAGKISRSEMMSISQNTSYIFGLLHWYEVRR